MPAFAPNWTGRLKVSYVAASAVHSQTWRYPGPSSGSGVTDLIAVIAAYYGALEAALWDDFTVNAVTVADLDSSIFLPIVNPFTELVGTVDSVAREPDDKADAVTFIGRSTGGHPWKISQYGLDVINMETGSTRNFRILAAENVYVSNAVAALQAGAGTVLANDANSVEFYNYANYKPNNRWVKKVRRGA